jgi:hypothetical protein
MNLTIFLLGFVRFVVDNVITPLANAIYGFYYRSIDYAKPLPKIKNDLLLVPAHKLAQKIRKKEVGCFSYFYYEHKYSSRNITSIIKKN